jgi:hypothetical protein
VVIPNPPITRVSLHTADGQVTADFVPAEEYERLRAEVVTLREQVATLRRQKDRYVAELTEVLKTSIPIPPTEEEVLAAVPNSDEVRKIIEDLEAR